MTDLSLSRPYMTILTHFRNGGGTAKLDRFGRVTLPTGEILQGDAVTWLHIIVSGAAFGRGGCLYLSEDGENAVIALEDRRAVAPIET